MKFLSRSLKLQQRLICCAVGVVFFVTCALDKAQAAPALEEDDTTDGGCYYMFNHYGEGDRIMTNEPCLNCTCHNSMLMCYLRVCPFTKPIGQDCIVEKRPDQCCPVITCPEVPVSLVTQGQLISSTSTTTVGSVSSASTAVALAERGCEMEGTFYPNGAQVISDPTKPCELCYCIRNRTACVMQECILHVEGCEPVFEPGVCCPVRYQCDIPPKIETTTSIAGLISTTLTSIFITSTQQPGGCYRDGEFYADGSQIQTPGEAPCEHCYCMRGEIVCAVQECGSPMEGEGENCTAIPPRAGLCCPEKYQCQGGQVDTTTLEPFTSTIIATEEKVDVEPSSTTRPTGEIQIDTTEAQEPKPEEGTSTPSQVGSTSAPEGVTNVVTEAEPMEQLDDQPTTQGPAASDRVKEGEGITSLSTSTEVVPEASTIQIGLATTLSGSSSTEVEAATTTEREVNEVFSTTSAADIEKEPTTTEKTSTARVPSDVAVTIQDEGVTTVRTTEATLFDETTVRAEEPQQLDDVSQTTGPTSIESTSQREVVGQTTEFETTERVSTDKEQVDIATATPTPEAGLQSTTQEAVSASEQPLADDKLGQVQTERPTEGVTATTVVVDDVVTQTTAQYSSTERLVTEVVTSQEGLSSTETATSSVVQDVTYQSTEAVGTSTTTSPGVEGVTQQEGGTERSTSPASLITETPTTQKEVTEADMTGAPEAPSATSEAPTSPAADDQPEPTTSVSVEHSTVQVSIEQTTQRETMQEVSVTSGPTTSAPAELQEGQTASTEIADAPTEGPAGIQTSTETSTDALVLGSTTPETKYADEGSTQKVDTESLVTGAAVTTSGPLQSTAPAELITETTTAKLIESSTVSGVEDETKMTTSATVESDTQRPSTVFATVTESVTSATTQKEFTEEDQGGTTQAAVQSTTSSSQIAVTSPPQASTETEGQVTDVTEFTPTSTVSSIEQVSSTETHTQTTQAEILSDDIVTSTTSASEELIGQTSTANVEDKASSEAGPTSTAQPSTVAEKEGSTIADVMGDTTTVLSVTQASLTESSLADEPEQPSTESISASTVKVEPVTSASTEIVDTTQEQVVTSTESGSTVSAIVTESATATTVVGEVTEDTATTLSPSSPVNLLSSPTTPISVTEISTISASTKGEPEGPTTSKVQVDQDEAVTEPGAASTSRPSEEPQGTSTVAQTEFTTSVSEIVIPTKPATGTTERPQDLLATSTEGVSVTTGVSVEEGSTTSAGTGLPQTSTVESITTSLSTEATQAPLFDQDQPSEPSTTERVEVEAGSTELPSEPKTTTFSTATESVTSVADDETKTTPVAVTTAPDTATATTKVEVTESIMQSVEGVSTVGPEGVSTSTERVDQTTVSEVQETAQPATSKPLEDDVVSGTTSEPVSQTTTGSSTESELVSTTEQVEVASTGQPRIPGEGSCFVEGITYRNGSRIPPSSPCQIACACQNSIVHCLLVHCPPPPTRFGDCKPIYMPQTCCPKYDCDVASSSPGSIVTPVSEEQTEEDKVIVTPEPSTSHETQTPESVVDVQSDDTGPSTTEAFGPTSTEKSTESISTEVKIDSTSEEVPTSPLLPQTVEPVEVTPGSTLQTEATEGTTARPVSQTEQVEGADVSTTPHPIVEAVSTTVATEFDNETSTTPLYPVTVSTTVTSSPATWPYPSQTTTPAGMSTGACLFDSRVYMSAQQILRDDPCDFCFCFRGDIICLQQSCPPPIPGCYEEPIPGFCCPRYECPVGNSTTGSQALLPPSYYHNQVLNNLQASSAPSIVSGSGPGCEVQGEYFEAGQKIKSASGPCLECRCGENGMMNCDPRECQPEPMLRKMIEAISS